VVGDEGRHALKSSHYGLNAKDNMGRVGQDDRRRLYDGRRTSAAEALRELCANVGFEETVNTAVQRLRNRAKASPALLLDAMGSRLPGTQRAVPNWSRWDWDLDHAPRCRPHGRRGWHTHEVQGGL